MYLYIKALHIIFIVTWFAGLFYMPRLLIYNTEANQKPEPVKTALHEQFIVMIKRLWWVITWPSAVFTLIFGTSTWYLMGSLPTWLLVKLFFVAGLYIYHFTLHLLVQQQVKGIFKYTSQQLRIWNEIATIFLVAIVMLAVVKQTMSFLWALAGLVLFIIILMSAVKIYKIVRGKNR
ncbi:MAG TPA: CopD family protein [Chitinophagaceae bacterium]|jgi:protoporphyrinogen IX oxidase|nr:CopD family protein [Chitinophagaceae bacterium]